MNVRDHIIRAKVPDDPKQYPERAKIGMKKCGNSSSCPYIREAKSLRISKKEWKINQSLNYEISKCVYMIECKKKNCEMRFIGVTKRILKIHLQDHKGYISNQDVTKATAAGHSLADLSISILEKS